MAAIAIGALVLVLAIQLRPSAPVNPSASHARLVEVMTLTKGKVSPQVKGYGRAAPKLVWQALSEVSGAVVYRNPLLEKGRFLAAGTELVRIDPLEYELAVAQAEADVNSARAQLARLAQQRENTDISLGIESNRLQLASEEFVRKQKLQQQGLTSLSELDNQQQSVLSQKKLVQELQNQLALLPDDIKVAKAQLKVSEARLQDANRKLSKTRVSLPFDARIAQVGVESGEVVSNGQMMVEADGLEVMEVEAQVAIHDLITLMKGQRLPLPEGQLPDVSRLNLDASVMLQSGQFEARWPATVARFSEAVNPAQATVGVILEVKQRYGEGKPRPPLTKGMFVEARLSGVAAEHFLVPEHALRGTDLYLMDDQQRLLIKPVTVLFRSGTQVAISGDLEPGMKVVVNDLIPAVAGMSLKVVQS
ncbi:HlyD family secretion protein [Ferrimonas sp. SCSIO 43195]|nr:HlyD family secretion protein [Ferrimonas sp. SCSIO 43195]